MSLASEWWDKGHLAQCGTKCPGDCDHCPGDPQDPKKGERNGKKESNETEVRQADQANG